MAGQVRDEAIEWVKRAPFKPGDEIEIRQVFDPADFAQSDPIGEPRAKEEELRKTVKSRRT